MDYSRHKFCLLYLLVAAALGLGAGYFYFGKMSAPKAGASREFSFIQATRKLWADHVIWTRCYIISAVADLPDLKPTTDRLLKNQDDIGGAITPFYGDAAGKKLAELLREHILVGAQVVDAAKKNDKKKLDEEDKKWHQNAEEIATFLSSANPNWPKKAMVDMLNMHLKLTTEEAVARINKKWDDDIKKFDEIFDQILDMANELAEGIIKQFPDKF